MIEVEVEVRYGPHHVVCFHHRKTLHILIRSHQVFCLPSVEVEVEVDADVDADVDANVDADVDGHGYGQSQG